MAVVLVVLVCAGAFVVPPTAIAVLGIVGHWQPDIRRSGRHQLSIGWCLPMRPIRGACRDDCPATARPNSPPPEP